MNKNIEIDESVDETVVKNQNCINDAILNLPENAYISKVYRL